MVLLERLSNVSYLVARSVSSKYVKPHPRQYRRRLFEAAVKPIMPEPAKRCGTWKLRGQQMQEERESFMPVELALVDKIQKWIKAEEFRVMAVCQQLSISERTRHFMRNGLRLKGIHHTSYSSRIMGKVFEDTPFRSLQPLFDGYENCFLFGHDLDAIKVIVNETARIPTVVPLAITFDWRILSMEEAEKLAKLSGVEDLRAEMVQILQRIPSDLAQSLDHHSQDLVGTLSRIS